MRSWHLKSWWKYFSMPSLSEPRSILIRYIMFLSLLVVLILFPTWTLLQPCLFRWWFGLSAQSNPQWMGHNVSFRGYRLGNHTNEKVCYWMFPDSWISHEKLVLGWRQKSWWTKGWRELSNTPLEHYYSFPWIQLHGFPAFGPGLNGLNLQPKHSNGLGGIVCCIYLIELWIELHGALRKNALKRTCER